MTIDLLSQDKATGYSKIRLTLTVAGEKRVYEQDVILPVGDNYKMREVLRKYAKDYEKSLNAPQTDEVLVEDIMARRSIGTVVKGIGDSIKNIF